MPRFTVRSILALTTFTAFALFTLAKPSIVWFSLWPFLISGLCIFVFVRITRLHRELAFWAGLVIGIITFMTATVFIDLVAAFASASGPPDELGAPLGASIYVLMHGDSAVSQKPSHEFVSFAVSLYTIVAIIWSGVATLLAQFFAKRGEP